MTPQQLTPQQPYLIQSRAIYHCPNCAGPVRSVFKPSSNTSNWLLFTIALLLTPFLVGIILWIIYLINISRENQTIYWHCESCGWHAAGALPKPQPRYQPVLRPTKSIEERRQWRTGKIVIAIVIAWIIIVFIGAMIAARSIRRDMDRNAIIPPIRPISEQHFAGSSDKEKSDSKQGKPRRGKVDSRAGNVEGGEDK